MSENVDWKVEAALLKERHEQHEKELGVLRKEFKEFRSDFRGLTEYVGELAKTFTAVKYSMYGALVLYGAQSIGIEKAIKLVLGVG
jgi:hypothetical protein